MGDEIPREGQITRKLARESNPGGDLLHRDLLVGGQGSYQLCKPCTLRAKTYRALLT